MKKNYILGIFLIITALSVIGVFWMTNKSDKELDTNVVENERSDSALESKEEIVSTVDINNGWENPVHSKQIDEWESGDEPFHENLVQETIQQMAHQKVIADEKEYSIMITPKRIDTVLQMVEENKDKYEHSDKYLDILKRWKQGDFTTVDYDHNVVMDIQGGKLIEGKARGTATEEQEIHYILQVFGKDVDKIFYSSTLKETDSIEIDKDVEVVEPLSSNNDNMGHK